MNKNQMENLLNGLATLDIPFVKSDFEDIAKDIASLSNAKLESKLVLPEDNTITFNISSHTPTEIIRFCENGDIYIKGKLVTNDIEVVEGLREFLNLYKHESE